MARFAQYLDDIEPNKLGNYDLIPQYPNSGSIGSGQAQSVVFCKEESNLLENQTVKNKAKCKMREWKMITVNVLGKKFQIMTRRHTFCHHLLEE